MIRNFLELCGRSYQGPIVKKDDWDMAVVENVAELVEKYGLSWNNEDITPVDDDVMDRMYVAAKELLATIGIYNISTERVIRLDMAEIESGLANQKRSLVMGEGKDAATLVARKPEDSSRPLIWAGNPGCPTPEHLFLPTVKSWLQEDVTDFITCGSLTSVDGIPVRGGEPSEVVAVKRELGLLRRARLETGRPGIGMLAAESSVSEVGDLCAAHPDYLRPCDSHLVAMFNELIIDRGNLVRAANSIEYGMRNASLACTMVGGMGGDAPGATMVIMASMMAANLLCLADYHLCHPIHIKAVATGARGCMWLQSVCCQSFARNAPGIIVCDVYPKSGGLTKELLYEVAASALVATVSGGHLEGCGSADGNRPHGTGLEVRLMGEVSRTATRVGLTRKEANGLILRLLQKYEHVLGAPEGNPGQPFDKCYDLATLRPVPEWEAMYTEVKSELRAMGLAL
ncbi:MAG: monomethylamine:corrinoid methyltransferase [Planctomycetota bacterium]|jgi:methylamine--corrinoid protein Co-methyltransferase|nr:monomethylamine:corrinoid methyltransferase [Planctomycetota bacterium]